MKLFKILLFTAMLTLIGFTCIAQNNQTTEIIVVGSVVQIENGKALIQSSSFSKHYKINAETLETGKEYRFRMVVNSIEKQEKHCSGCTGILPANLIGYSYTPRQVKIDAMRVDKIPIGYSRSPRY